jgi:hypothetical protein
MTVGPTIRQQAGVCKPNLTAHPETAAEVLVLYSLQ